MKHDNDFPKAAVIAFGIALVALLVLILRAVVFFQPDKLTGRFLTDMAGIEDPGTDVEDEINEAIQDIYGFEYEKTDSP